MVYEILVHNYPLSNNYLRYAREQSECDVTMT